MVSHPRAHLLLLGRGVKDDDAVEVDGAGDAAEEGGEGQPCIQHPHAGSVQAAGEQLGHGGVKDKAGGPPNTIIAPPCPPHPQNTRTPPPSPLYLPRIRNRRR